MATEYDKTTSFKRGLEGKSARSGWSLKFADKDEVRENERGKREKALIDAKNSKKKK